MSVHLHNVVDLICLLYHEARNIRHPIKAGKLIDAPSYPRLASLPNNRDCAWRHMSMLRSRAADSGTIEAARETFEQFFGASSRDLVILFEMAIWKHSACGGNKWADISSKVCDLVDAMTAGPWPQAEDLYREIMSLRHNTGQVADKLRRLHS